MQRIAVSVYDEDEIFRRGVVACLGDDSLLEIVASGARPGDADPPPDVAVVSPALLDVWQPPCPVVVCASTPVAAARRSREVLVGAVLRRSSVMPDQLVSAVRAAAVGLRIADSARLDGGLDERTVHVLRLLADGAGTREISDALGWSERTIKGVIATVQRDFRARTRTHAVAEALRRQLI